MRFNMYHKVGAVILLTAVLAACGGNGNPVTQNPVTSGSLESKFGSEFAAIFDASSTAQPATLDNNSVPPLQPADKPVTFPS